MFSIMAAGLQRCLQDARPGRSYYPHAVTHAARRCAALFHLGGLLGLIMDLTDEGHARLSAAASSSCLHRLVFLRICVEGCEGRERSLGPALVLRLVPVIFTSSCRT